MQKVYVRELKPYSLEQLGSLFECPIAQAKALVGDLMMRGIMRRRTGKKSDQEEIDAEGAAPDELYQFLLVGLALIGDIVLVAYPKYFRNSKPTDDELKLIMQAIKHHEGVITAAHLEDGGGATDDKLPVMLTLLELYGEFGEYSNYIDGFEPNGSGSIDWNRTIGAHLPILSNGQPIYTEYETRKTFRDDSDYIARLHRAVLSECSQTFHEAGVDKLLSLDEVWLADERVEDLDDIETLSQRIDRERSMQFIDWKLMTLDLLERYLLNRANDVYNDEIRTLGTTSFHKVWEDACKVAFNDALDKPLDNLGLTLKGDWGNSEQEKLIGIIPRPQWERWNGTGFDKPEGTDTLIPDTISIQHDPKSKKSFCIYDAKYYVPTTNGKMKRQPGLESVTKQFLYQSAYRSFVVDHEFDQVTNMFLVPGTVDEPKLMARVSFPDVIANENRPFSNFIYMWMLPANEVFKAFLTEKTLDSAIAHIGNMPTTDPSDAESIA